MARTVMPKFNLEGAESKKQDKNPKIAISGDTNLKFSNFFKQLLLRSQSND